MMPRMVKLQDVVKEMDQSSDDRHPYLSRLTGKLVVVSDEDFRAIEEGDDIEAYPNWQQQTIEKAKEILETDEYLPLPGKGDIREYSLIEQFCEQIQNAELRNLLLVQLNSLGAVRNFKRAIHQYNIADDWHRYRYQALREVAKDWLKKNGFEYN